MLLSKDKGGCTVLGYTWENDGDAIEVDDSVAYELLAIRGGDYSVPDDAVLPAELSKAPRTPRKGKAVTEPAPAADAAVTEPAPDGAVTEAAAE